MSDISEMQERADRHSEAGRPSRKVLCAAIVAALVLLAGGFGYRAQEDRYAQPPSSIPLPPDTLNRLPTRVGLWWGRDMPMDEWVAKATDADINLLRVYTRAGDAQPVSFYAAYGIRGRDMIPHRPEVCYPGEGWTLLSDQINVLQLPDGTPMPCRVFRFTRSGLNIEKLRVMNFLLIDGRFYPDVSEIRKEVWQGSGRIRYIARIMLTCDDSDSDAADASVSRLSDLAVLMAGPLRDLMPGAPHGPSTTEPSPEEFHEAP